MKLTGTLAQRRAKRKFMSAGPALRKKWARKAARTRCAKKLAACRASSSTSTAIDRSEDEYGDYGYVRNPEVDNITNLGQKHLSVCRDFTKNPSENPMRPFSGRGEYEVLGRKFEDYETARAFAERKATDGNEDVHIMKDLGPWSSPFSLVKVKPSRNPLECCGVNPNVLGSIRAGDKVTIVNRFGQRSTGRAVMRGPHGWVLNMGGAHGTPAIADDENIVKISPSRHRRTASNPEILVWTDQGGTMLPSTASNPGEEVFEENPRKRKNRKKRKSRSRRRGRRCYRRKGYRVKSHRVCRKGGRRKGGRGRRSGIKRGKRLLTFKAAKARYGMKGANTYRRKYGVKKLKG